MSSDCQREKARHLTIWLSMENVKKIEIVKSVKCTEKERGTREFGCGGNMSIENSILNDGEEREKNLRFTHSNVSIPANA